jgi:hypothetical protein
LLVVNFGVKMRLKNSFLISLMVILISGCSTPGGYAIRFDKEPGGRVDEKAYGIEFPLCLKTDPQALRLLSEEAGDGLRVVVWTRVDGSERRGTWYMSKSRQSEKPPEYLINIWFDWPTVKRNIGVQFAATLVFAQSLVEDESVPYGGKLSEYVKCLN